ncbi:MAG: hypothetical protein CVT94_17985 [Bacteroidetes bacterium HGW-Bacteroidetes-11]|jgi:hypothetical protein|nr:MAG: hypothetical protein CVT94_17985 [Bacteroidetes bacterium HGW-Bacteroidetes-11]
MHGKQAANFPVERPPFFMETISGPTHISGQKIANDIKGAFRVVSQHQRISLPKIRDRNAPFILGED